MVNSSSECVRHSLVNSRTAKSRRSVKKAAKKKVYLDDSSRAFALFRTFAVEFVGESTVPRRAVTIWHFQEGLMMQLGMIGLGRMGANMVRRLMKRGHECVVFDRSADAIKALVQEKAVGASSLSDFIKKLAKPRAI